MLVFVIWTWLIQKVDVQPVGQKGTDVGFAAFNCWFHRLTGVHMGLYTIADWLGLVPVFVCIIFGGIGFWQLIVSIPTIVGCIGAAMIIVAAVATPIAKSQRMREIWFYVMSSGVMLKVVVMELARIIQFI